MVTDTTAESQAHKFWRERCGAGRQGGQLSGVCLVWIKVYRCVHECMYMYVCIYIYTYIHTYIHTYIYKCVRECERELHIPRTNLPTATIRHTPLILVPHINSRPQALTVNHHLIYPPRPPAPSSTAAHIIPNQLLPPSPPPVLSFPFPSGGGGTKGGADGGVELEQLRHR